MKRILGLVIFCIASTASPGFAQSREIVQIQQSVALLQGMVREMQRNFDEKMAVMRTLVEQSSEQTNRLGSDLSTLQQSIQSSVGNAGQKVDNISTQVQGLQASLDDLRARLDRLSQQMTKLETASQNISAGGSMGMGSFGETGMGTPPSPDVLYNTALRDYTSGNYPLSLQEFLEYLRYYPSTSLASNAQFYIGDIY
jgi:TolA-binding protein